ncbi:MAG: hypothetical protein JNL88_00550 [Bacteroidia bacterium]|nr:hypothetical protein [Bacteroidia bacterium]
MKKLYASFFLLLLLSAVTTSSGQSLRISPDNIDGNGYDYAKVIGQDDDGVYLLMSNLSLESSRDRFGLKTRKYELSYYGPDLQPRWRKAIEADPEGGSLENIGFFNGKAVVVSSELVKSNAEFNLYISVLNAKGEAIVKGLKIYSGAVGKSADLSKPRLLVSPDKQYLGVAVEESSNGTIFVHLGTVNDQFQASRQARAALNFSVKEAELSEFALTGKEDLLFLAYRKDPQEGEKSKLRKFSLYMLSQADQRTREYSVNTAGQQMTEAALVIDRINNKAIVTGFYADKTSFAGASLLYATLNLGQADQFQVKTGQLNNDAQLKLVGQRNTGGGVSLISYPIQRVIPRSDGGALLIAEAAYLSEYNFYDYFTQTFNRRLEFHFDNILALSVNADGSIHWSQLIQKEQSSLDDEGLYSSFNTILSPDELVVIFNNEIGRNNEIVGHAIDARGQLQVRKLSKKTDSISLLPRSGKQVDENTLIVPAVTKKRLFLVRIEI